jgi:hypothetical protein
VNIPYLPVVLSFDLVYLQVKLTNYLLINLGGYLEQEVFGAVVGDCVKLCLEIFFI